MKAIFTFGRFNPPTIGHEKLIKKVESIANGSDFFVYPSWTQNSDKDPLPHALKVKYMKSAFPKYVDNIISNPKCKTAIHVLTNLYDSEYDDVTMVVGSDRVDEFDKLLNKYNGKESSHGYYKFEKGVKVVSAGSRDPDAQGVEGMSASKMRQAVKNDDFDSFQMGVPSSMSEVRVKKMFMDLKKHMGLREARDKDGNPYLEGTPSFRQFCQDFTPEEDVVDFTLERSLSDVESKTKEKMVMQFKKNQAFFKKKYGKRWKEVMYATATNIAKNESKIMSFSQFITRLED